MRIVLQRVKKATVRVNENIVSSIGIGLLALLAVEEGDTYDIALSLADKIVNLRIFEDEFNKMNLSVKEVRGSILVVPQFTLVSRISKGNRPSFSEAMEENKAELFYEAFVGEIKRLEVPVKKGIFKAHMEVLLVNDGPVTFILERKSKEFNIVKH